MSVAFFIILVIVLAILVAVAYIANKVNNAIKTVKPIVDQLNEGLPDQIYEIENNPKSVNAMTSVYLPRIEKDFPDFNYFEFRTKAENMLVSALDAISENDISRLIDASLDLRNQILGVIDNNIDNRHNEIYRDVKIHRTEIKNYVKENGTCVITLQSAVEFHHFVKKYNGELVSGSETSKKQTRFDTELTYVQDITKVATGDTAVANTCPNCGAPITGLGHNSCPYCSSALQIVNIRAWSINRITEA